MPREPAADRRAVILAVLPHAVVDRYALFREFPVLRTKRLLLRELTLDDVEWYLRHFSEPEIVKGDACAGPDGFEGAEKELQQYVIDLFARREGFRWGLQIKDGAQLIGSAGFYKWQPHQPHRAEMGYDLDPDYWGRGLMTEALIRIIDFGFRSMRLGRIEVIIAPRNRRSIRLARRLGFAREGLLREHSLDEQGMPADDAMFSLLKREWNPAKVRLNKP